MVSLRSPYIPDLLPSTSSAFVPSGTSSSRTPWTRKKKEKGIKDVLTYVEIAGVELKVTQFKKFEQWLGQKCKRMVLFDDKAENMDVERWAGARFYKIANRQIPNGGILNSKVKHIGYVEADKVNAQRYANGERRTPSNRASR
ncbi:hypothetical protein VTI74DRAFT_1381 [Chaetomium olivicolor]